MLTESELDISSKAVRDVLQSHATLVEEYRRLKSDYEEERDARERYKKLAKSSTSDKGSPFVVVLVDGDHYIFNNDLISGGADGGKRAAQLLNQAVLESLRNTGLEHCCVVVRIYANVSALSRGLSKLRLAGPEKRSIAPLVANFNASNDLFDFIDAGELEGSAASKIGATLRFFDANRQCQHIYFAGCHNAGYINDVSASAKDRITLVRNHAFQHRFHELGMRVEEFRKVFRSTPLESTDSSTDSQGTKSAPSHHPAQTKTAVAEPHAIQRSMPHRTVQRSMPPCAFYQKGTCKNGDSCKFPHVKIDTKEALSANWRPALNSKEDTRFTSSADNDFMRGNRRTTEQAVNGASNLAEDFTSLPDNDEIPLGKIPVNSKNQRLDPQHPSCTPEDRRECNERIGRHKLCNKYHLNDTCTDSACEYDHRPISDGMRAHLKSVASGQPCKRKGECRYLDCILGHVCQRADCTRRGGKAFCKLPMAAHYLDMYVAHYVDGTSKTNLIDVDSSSYYQTSRSQSPVQGDGDANGDSVEGITKADLARYFNRGNKLPDLTANGGGEISSHMDPESDDEKAGAGIDASQIPW
ncbi:hypothetical protein B0A48_17065 [Cryoendolithus antarcticus]|uniref:C3H1-type domain-containing protein n=1 Tax=Cryoendolithus antarcticus TaxID=1507870 RepID=A0A1V8SBH6_9PEZI|nr:hypothetical protein B0A48_17065 [Cryoendolithus antarcticus]